MNNHDDIRKLLSAYSGGDLEKSERMQVEEHLAGCAACRAELADLQTSLRLIRTTPESEPPTWLATRIMARVREQEQNKHSWLHRILFPLHIKLPIEALALLLVCVSGYYMARNVETQMKQPASQQDIPASTPETGKPAGAAKQEDTAAAPRPPAPPPAAQKEPGSEKNIPAQPTVSKAADQVAPQHIAEESGKPSPQPAFAPAPPVMKGEHVAPAAESLQADIQPPQLGNSVKAAKRAMPAAADMKRKSLSKGETSEAVRGASVAPAGVGLPQISIHLNMFVPASAPASLKEAIIRCGGAVIDDSITQHANIKARIPANSMDKLLEQLDRLGKVVERPPTRDLQGIVEIEIIW